jgi:SAM-dependent methyltransferase
MGWCREALHCRVPSEACSPITWSTNRGFVVVDRVDIPRQASCGMRGMSGRGVAAAVSTPAPRRYATGPLAHDIATEERRLRLLEDACDPMTIALLERFHLQRSWNCLEIGAGAGSIARWMAERCESITATDVGTRLLRGVANKRVLVLEHDVTRDEFPAASFDLVHARGVFGHLPERESILPKVAAWLRPGGWLVLEDFSDALLDHSPHDAYRTAMIAGGDAMASMQGTDFQWPRCFPQPLAAVGLCELGLGFHPVISGGGTASSEFMRLTLQQLAPAIEECALASRKQVQSALAAFENPAFRDFGYSLFTCWGRRR